MAAIDELWALVEEYGEVRYRQGFLAASIQRTIDALLIMGSPVAMDERITQFRSMVDTAAAPVVVKPNPLRPIEQGVDYSRMTRMELTRQALVDYNGKATTHQVIDWCGRRGVSMIRRDLTSAVSYMRKAGILKPSTEIGVYELASMEPSSKETSNLMSA